MKTAKLEQLASIEGYPTVMDMLEAATYDSVSPGICVNEGCDYSTNVEPDSCTGWCEECETNTVSSCLCLAGIL